MGRERSGGLGGTAGSLGATRGPQGVKCPTNASPGHRRDALPVAVRITICLMTAVPSHTVGGVVDPELRTQLEAMIHGCKNLIPEALAAPQDTLEKQRPAHPRFL